MGSVRKLLVIADDSPEWRDALVYAGFRARNTGAGVVVLRTLEPARFEHWAGVREEMRRQALSDAEAALRLRLAEVREICGVEPVPVIREGALKTELQALVQQDPAIKVLVLAAGKGFRGPGPLVSAVIKGHLSSLLRLPVVVIPPDLARADLEALA